MPVALRVPELEGRRAVALSDGFPEGCGFEPLRPAPGLAPGDYKLFAFDSVEQIEFRNPEVLDQYSSKAVQVTLTARGKANATLELVHTEEQ